MTTCSEGIPQGATKPVVKDSFPPAGVSGHSATLRVDIEHGRGESVLPQGLALGSTGAQGAWTEIRSAGFALPDRDAGAPARLTESAATQGQASERTHTILELPLVLLPKEPGRARLELPPLPIVVARSNGDVMTVCTSPHGITVEDPIANVAEAIPQPNPAFLPQREDWRALRIGVMALAAALVLALIVAYLATRWARRPRKIAPPPPPKPAWDVALTRLAEIRASGLIERGELREYVDAVSDVLRTYLGARYGFDGIESTTEEIRRALLPISMGQVSIHTVVALLEASDLVKFAGVTPPPDDCLRMMDSTDEIVRSTIIVPRIAPPAPPSGPGSASGSFRGPGSSGSSGGETKTGASA